ncbi:hypothetical protein VPH35_025117 [Triticum aestivum]
MKPTSMLLPKSMRSQPPARPPWRSSIACIRARGGLPVWFPAVACVRILASHGGLPAAPCPMLPQPATFHDGQPPVSTTGIHPPAHAPPTTLDPVARRHCFLPPIWLMVSHQRPPPPSMQFAFTFPGRRSQPPTTCSTEDDVVQFAVLIPSMVIAIQKHFVVFSVWLVP